MTAQLQLLAVYFADPGERRHWRLALTSLSEFQSVIELDNGWLLAESPLGTAQSRSLGSPEAQRFLLGEELFLSSPHGVREIAECLAASPTELDQFQGDFSFAQFKADGKLEVARSCVGVPALYVSSARGFTALSTRIEWIGLVVPDLPPIDWLPLALYASGWPCFPDSRSPLRGVHYVKRGVAVHIAPSSPAYFSRYWKPCQVQITAPGAEQRRHLASVVRHSLFSELERQTSASGEHLTFFSGGIDSASVAAVTHQLGRSQLAVSQLPPVDSPETSRERRYINGTNWFSRHFVEEFSYDRALAEAVDGPPTFYPTGQYWQQLTARGLRPQSVAGGWFADEALGVLRIPDWVAAARAPDLGSLARHVTDPLHALRRWYQWRSVPSVALLPVTLPRLFAALVGDDYRAFRLREVAAATASAVTHSHPAGNERLQFLIENVDLVGIFAETCAAFGGVSIQPFASRKLVEAASVTHPANLFYQRAPKSPLREAMRGILPELYRGRVDSGDFTVPDRPSRLLAPEQVTQLHAALQPWLDKPVFQGQSRLTWQDQVDLGWIHRIAARHQALHHDRQKLRTTG